MMPAIGVLIEKSTPTVAVMQWIGPCTIFTGLDWTRPNYWVGIDGRLTSTMPTIGIGGYVFVQAVGKAVASDIFLINGNLDLFKRTS